MEEIRRVEELEHTALPDNVAHVVRETLAALVAAYADGGYVFDPVEDGHVAVLQETDTDATVSAVLGHPLREVLFEGCSYAHGCFVACVLFNNQFGISVIVPDAAWLDPALRVRLTQDL